MAASVPESLKKRLAFQKSYSQEHKGKHRSLIDDAKFETIANAEFEKQEHQGQDGTPEEARKCLITFATKQDFKLSRIFQIFEGYHAAVLNVETRKSRCDGSELDFLIHFQAVNREEYVNTLMALKQLPEVDNFNIITSEKESSDTILIPKHISHLDYCNHLLTKFDPDMDYQHPGFSDLEYRARRKEIADMAFVYKSGQPIPTVEYTKTETETWSHVYSNLSTLYPGLACQEHINVFKLLEKEGLYREDRIPQLEDVSNFLKKRTGFQLRPVAGLLSARDFLSSLAFRVFQCTQYIRHGSKPDHTVEPDCVHELLGHVPMLADPSFAQFSQEIGLASLGADDADIEKFATLYWFTVEFGLCKQNGEIRAFGAGLLSAYGELTYALSDKPEKRPFDPATASVQKYDDQDYQTVYFVAESFEDMKEKVRQFAAAIKRPAEVRYDPYTQTIQILDNMDSIRDVTLTLKGELNSLCNAFVKIGQHVRK